MLYSLTFVNLIACVLRKSEGSDAFAPCNAPAREIAPLFVSVAIRRTETQSKRSLTAHLWHSSDAVGSDSSSLQAWAILAVPAFIPFRSKRSSEEERSVVHLTDTGYEVWSIPLTILFRRVSIKQSLVFS